MQHQARPNSKPYRCSNYESSLELTQDILSASGADDDLSSHGGDANFHPGVAILGELPGEKLVKLGEEHTVCYELQTSGAILWGSR